MRRSARAVPLYMPQSRQDPAAYVATASDQPYRRRGRPSLITQLQAGAGEPLWKTVACQRFFPSR